MTRITPRDIIVNALDEARLVKRSQPVPGDMFVSAMVLLQNRLSEYSNTNLLSFVRNEVDFIPSKGITVIAEHDDEREDIDVEVDNLQEVMRCYVRPKNSNNEEWMELRFVAYEDFYAYSSSNYVYSILPTGEGEVKLFLKKPFYNGNYEVKLMYNVFFDFNSDTEINIPRQYISLFTAGLVYDLACKYPRLSDSTVALLEKKLLNLEENVRRSSSVNKFITRTNGFSNGFAYEQGLNGSFLYGE